MVHSLQQYLVQLDEYARLWEPAIDIHQLSHMINECVQRGQRRLREEFDYRRRILVSNVDDHRGIREFYQLNPNDEQVDLKLSSRCTTSMLMFSCILDTIGKTDLANHSERIKSQRIRRNTSSANLFTAIASSHRSYYQSNG